MSAHASSAAQIQPRRRFPVWRAFLAIVVVAASIWAGLSRPWETKPVQVVLETVNSGPAERVLAIKGRIAPEMQVDVSSTVGGRLRAVLVQEGDAVRSGELLAILDDEQQQAAVAQAEAALDGATAALRQAKFEFERAKALGETTSRKNIDAAQFAVQTAEAAGDRLSAARNQVVSLLTEYRIEAPFDGTVLVRGVDPGQVVSSSTVLFLMADLTHLRAEANVDELYTSEIRRGLKARLQPSGYNRTLEGEVSSISPTVDSNTGGRLVRVAIADTQGLALPIGLTVNLNILVAQEASAITVPRSAIVDAATAPAVFVVAGGEAKRQPIEFIDWPSSRLIVRGGLKDGDQIITDPKTIVDGTAVVVKGG